MEKRVRFRSEDSIIILDDIENQKSSSWKSPNIMTSSDMFMDEATDDVLVNAILALADSTCLPESDDPYRGIPNQKSSRPLRTETEERYIPAALPLPAVVEYIPSDNDHQRRLRPDRWNQRGSLQIEVNEVPEPKPVWPMLREK
jgi:hypothetical protein